MTEYTGVRRVSDVVLELEGVSKRFDGQTIIDNLSIQIARGEFVTLLGSSGCGKTTILRMIAGLETADAGRVLLNGEDVTGYEPDRRNVNTVFQNYALFPHMNVFDNVVYGPRIRGAKKLELRERAAEILALVEMSGYEKRMPQQLSGGQRQRIAIARALINQPDIVLLDEPLGALDLKLRRHMQMELKRLQRKTGVTFIYVTHDQDEALDMSDKIAVMNGGVFEQIGAPEVVYNAPETRFVAEFVGTRNLVAVKGCGGEAAMLGEHRIGVARGRLAEGEEGYVAIHADKTRLLTENTAAFGVPGVVMDTTYSGSQVKTRVALRGAGVDTVFSVVEYNALRKFAAGETVFLHWEPHEAAVVQG